MAELDKNDLLIITRIISNMLRFVGLSMLIPTIVSIHYQEYIYTEIFAIMGLSTFIIFSIIHKLIRERDAKLKHAIISIALVWIAVGLISSIPFLVYGIAPIDAFFESVSGWTGTGLSVIQNPENLPNSINFWRAFIQWIGGFGIVILALVFYAKPETAQRLFDAEGRTENFFTNIFKIARMIVIIYLIYTTIGIILFTISGMSLIDSIIHTFTSISTGGFSNKTQGIGFFGTIPMIITIMLMIIGGISFESHYQLLKGRIKNFFGNPEILFLFAVIILSFLLIIFNLSANQQGQELFDGFFYVVSAITGTGATTTNPVSGLPALTIFIIILLMVFGSCYGSTTGALKIWRILIFYKVIRREVNKAFMPQKSIIPIRIGDKIISDESAMKALSYMALYISILVIGSIIFMIGGFGIIESIFTIASAQGNVGLNIIPQEQWFSMNPLYKLLLSLHMIIGRMEIIPLLITFKSLKSIKAHKI